MYALLLLALSAGTPALQQGSPASSAAYHGRTEWKQSDLEGYAGASSVRPGETLAFHVSARARYRVEIVRCGAREQLVQKAEDLPAKLQPVPENSFQDGCGWAPSFYLPIPEGWSSGLYKARLFSSEADDHEIPFVVRPKLGGPRARILTLTPDITVQAYNSHGGRNAYGTPMGRMSPLLSFERPSDALSPGTLDRQWDLDFLSWLTGELDALDYASDTDLHREAQLLDDYDLLVLFGHHEYWTREMRAAIDAFVGNGGNLFLVGSNVSYWQIRLNEKARNFRCHKLPWEDPIFAEPARRRGTTSLFATAPVFDPPETSFGISFRQAGCAGSGPGDRCAKFPIQGVPASFGYLEGFGHYRLAQPEHPFLEHPFLEHPFLEHPFLEHPFLERPVSRRGTLFGVDAFGSRVDERMISAGGELDGANLEGVPGGLAASRASGSPGNLLVLADAPAVNGFATVATFRNRGTVFHTGSLGFLKSGAHPELYVPEVRECLARALHALLPSSGNLLRNGGFERWNGNAPLHYRVDGALRATRRASGGKLALQLREMPVSATQVVSIPKRVRALHLSLYAHGLRGEGEVVVHKDGVDYLRLTIERGSQGYRYGRCEVPSGIGELQITLRKSAGGTLIVDDLELLTELAFERRTWSLKPDATTSRPLTIPAGQHTGGERLLVTCEARAAGGAGELRLYSRVEASDRDDAGTEPLLGTISFSGDWQRYQFEAHDPLRGTLVDFRFELLPFKGSEVELRELHVLPLNIPSPPPASLLMAEADSISTAASPDEASSIVRHLGPLQAVPYLLTGWVRGEAELHIGTERETFVSKRISSDRLVGLQEEFSGLELPADDGRITLVVAPGGEATLKDIRIRPKSEVVENDHVSNGAFEIGPSEAEIAAGLNWADRPPGWAVLDDSQLLLDRKRAYRGRASLRLTSDSKTGGAQYLLPDHLPVTSPLRLHARVFMEPGTKASVRLMATVFQPERTEIEVASMDLDTDAGPAREWLAVSLSAPPKRDFDRDYPVRGWVRIELQEGTLWLDDLIVEADAASLFDSEIPR